MVAKKKKIAAPASSPVTGKKKTIHATTTTTTGDDHRAHRAQEQQQKQQKQQQQPPQQQQQQQRVSRLGKAVQDAATIKKKPKNKGQHQAKKKSTVIPMMNRMDSRVDPSRMGKNRSREGTSERLTPRAQSPPGAQSRASALVRLRPPRSPAAAAQ